MGVFQVDTISQVSEIQESANIGKITVLKTFATVFLGTVISNIVCFLVWKGSATSKLQCAWFLLIRLLVYSSFRRGDINKTLESFATLVDLLCHSFLSDDT